MASPSSCWRREARSCSMTPQPCSRSPPTSPAHDRCRSSNAPCPPISTRVGLLAGRQRTRGVRRVRPPAQPPILPWRHARRDEVPTITDILSDLADEYRAARLDWHADEAEVAIAWLHVATRHLDGFASIAALLGSAHWMPIVGLAERAVACGRTDVAHAVFHAADQPGWHCDYLRRRRTELLGEATPRLYLSLRSRLAATSVTCSRR